MSQQETETATPAGVSVTPETLNDERAHRLAKREAIIAAGGDPYPEHSDVRDHVADIEGRYADSLPTDVYEKAVEHLGDNARCEEDVLSYIAFPQVAEKFFDERREREEKTVRYTITEA